MRENMYNLGYSVALTIPIAIALFCIWKIRKNRYEMKQIEEELKRQSAPAQDKIGMDNNENIENNESD